MRLIIGFLIINIGFIAASIHLQQGLESYWDFVAFSVVIFGTLSVMYINRPAIAGKTILKNFKQSIFESHTQTKNFVNDCISFARGQGIKSKKKTIENQFLIDGTELIGLGFNYEKIESILTQRYQYHAKSVTQIANWFRKNSKYPPAFGLAGTVLGLIHLMRGISEGINPQETGIRMAVALVATFYGLVIANIILNPIGELLLEKLKHDEEKAEIALTTIRLMMEKASLIEIQEELNSFVESENKINILGDFTIEGVA